MHSVMRVKKYNLPYNIMARCMMREFRIPKQPISATKSVRFPVEMIDEVEEAIRGQDCTFSTFVVSAVRWALDNLKEQEEEKNKGEQP